MTNEGLFQIGEVAEAVGLSLKTIRHYDEIGIVVPSARSAGGFRLYTQADIDRFIFVKQLKPLGFSLDEVQTLVAALDRAIAGQADEACEHRLEEFARMAEERCQSLREQLEAAESVASELRRPITPRLPPSSVGR